MVTGNSKTIFDLATYTVNDIKSKDLLFITDVTHQETKKLDIDDLTAYVVLHTTLSGSDYNTGSFKGTLDGTASYAYRLVYDGIPNGTASYALTASYASGSKVIATSSSYALTASYALNGGGIVGNSPALVETVTQINHNFSIGDALYVYPNNNPRIFYRANSEKGVNGNNVVGVVQSISSNDVFTVVYGGILEFGSNPTPSYFQTTNGNVYFLSGSTGKLNIFDPSLNDDNHISKPVLIKTGNTTALIVNQRALNEKDVVSSSYSKTSSFSETASYAKNGGNVTNYVTDAYYIDTIPIGSVVAFASDNIASSMGYLKCDGSYFLISTYQELFNAINQNNATYAEFGKRYSYDNGAYTINPTNGLYFKIPNLIGMFIRGNDPSRTFGSLQTNTLSNGSDTSFTNLSLTYYIKAFKIGLTNIDLAKLVNNQYPTGGDLTGYINNPTVVKIQGKSVSSDTPNDGDILIYDAGSTSWKPVIPNIVIPSKGIAYFCSGNSVPDPTNDCITINGITNLPQSTWTVPNNVTSIKLQMCGGGGGSLWNAPHLPAGSGSFICAIIRDLTPGTNVMLQVGKAGWSGNDPNNINNYGNGSVTWFSPDNNTVIAAYGGDRGYVNSVIPANGICSATGWSNGQVDLISGSIMRFYSNMINNGEGAPGVGQGTGEVHAKSGHIIIEW